MNDEQLEGIILNVIPFKENDAILHVLTKQQGIISVLAKGILKISSKNASNCQKHMYVNMYVTKSNNSDFYRLKQSELKSGFIHIHSSLTKQVIMDYMCECMLKSEIHDGFSYLYEICMELNQTNNIYKYLCLFQSYMNAYHGIIPFVDGCVRCGSEKGIHGLSIDDGGFICEKCMHDQDIILHRQDLKLFRILCKITINQYDQLDDSYIFNLDHFILLYHYFERYGGIKINSIDFLLEVLTLEV